jgi:hypothetical protein
MGSVCEKQRVMLVVERPDRDGESTGREREHTGDDEQEKKY